MPDAAPRRAGRVAGLPLLAWVAIGVAAVVGIVVAFVLTGGDDDRVAVDLPPATSAGVPATSAPAATTAPTTAVATTAPATTVTEPVATTAAPTTAPAVAHGDGSTPDAPLPVGVAESTFVFEGLEGAGEGTVIGVFEVPTWEPDQDDDYTCYVVVGTLRPTQITGVVSDRYDLPLIDLLVDGERSEYDMAACDTSSVSGLGYRAMFDTQATVGTDVPFYIEYTFPEGVRPDVVAVSNYSGEGTVYFDATPGRDVPTPPAGEVGPLTVEPIAVAAGAPARATYASEYSDDVWSVAVLGVVDAELDEYLSEDGTCVIVLLEYTPDRIDAGIVSQGFTAPEVGVVADGRLVDDTYGCDDTAVSEAGYVWLSDAEATPGTTVPVYVPVFIAAPQPGDVMAIVVGDIWGGAADVFAPFVFADVPPATDAPGVPSGVTTSPVGEPVTADHEYDGSTWELTVHGLVVAEPVLDDDGVCRIVLVEATKTAAGPDGDVETAAPYPYLLADGRLVHDNYLCDTDAVEAAGYASWFDGMVAEGASAWVYAEFHLTPEQAEAIELIVLGDPGADTAVTFAPTVIDTPPPSGG